MPHCVEYAKGQTLAIEQNNVAFVSLLLEGSDFGLRLGRDMVYQDKERNNLPANWNAFLVHILAYYVHRLPLLMAVVHGHEDMVHLLLQRENTRVNQSVIDSDYHGLTALFLATCLNNERVARLLLKAEDIKIAVCNQARTLFGCFWRETTSTASTHITRD
ncbi:hypothetical protein FPQ18DRAFT_308034 [Pyronema domesticum]|nr:hypothetical protein FPQ18DRAFT_308034 [Pyronema domesticum]